MVETGSSGLRPLRFDRGEGLWRPGLRFRLSLVGCLGGGGGAARGSSDEDRRPRADRATPAQGESGSSQRETSALCRRLVDVAKRSGYFALSFERRVPAFIRQGAAREGDEPERAELLEIRVDPRPVPTTGLPADDGQRLSRANVDTGLRPTDEQEPHDPSFVTKVSMSSSRTHARVGGARRQRGERLRQVRLQAGDLVLAHRHRNGGNAVLTGCVPMLNCRIEWAHGC